MINKKVVVFYNGQQREGKVVDEKADKVKVYIFKPGNYKIQDYNWFDVKDVRFLN